jgi:hypothetical protein
MQPGFGSSSDRNGSIFRSELLEGYAASSA